jgi:hypothetical protein
MAAIMKPRSARSIESNPQQVVAALYAKRLKLGGGKKISKYTTVRIEDHENARQDQQ